ncbi:MAG: hypothetical protein HKN30_14875 [Sulfitobacter sp.]|nr:hypothetical protein [Sulfitobacter sp.]
MRPMHRKFIATIAAASIAITAMGSAPAFADEYDTQRLLAAILGLAVVGKIIHDNKKDKKRSTYEYRHEPRVIHEQPRHRTYQQPRQGAHDLAPRPLPRRVDRKLLPGQCLRSFDTRDGRVRMFGRKCLQNNYRFTHRLPQHCMTRVRTDRGKRHGYAARCLRREGYRLAHR